MSTTEICPICGLPCEGPIGSTWTWYPEPVHYDCCLHTEALAPEYADGGEVIEEATTRPAPWGTTTVAGDQVVLCCQICEATKRGSAWSVYGSQDAADRGMHQHVEWHAVGCPIDSTRTRTERTETGMLRVVERVTTYADGRTIVH